MKGALLGAKFRLFVKEKEELKIKKSDFLVSSNEQASRDERKNKESGSKLKSSFRKTKHRILDLPVICMLWFSNCRSIKLTVVKQMINQNGASHNKYV